MQANISVETIVNTLVNIREAVLKEVGELADTQLNAKPKRETWSILQNLHHLYLVEQSVTSALVYALQRNEQKDVPFKSVHMAADRTTKVQSPEQMLPTETIMSLAQICGLLERSREQLMQQLKYAEIEQLVAASLKHPIFGDINLYQWLEFLGYHEQRHLQQIQEAKRALLA